MAFGTFDIFHKGHEFYLKNAKKTADELIVIIARDNNVKNIKGKQTHHNEKKRLNEVKKQKIADLVVLGDKKDFYHPLKKYKPDILCIGYDQRAVKIDKEKLNLLGLKNTKIKRIQAYHPDKYKSSIIKKGMR